MTDVIKDTGSREERAREGRLVVVSNRVADPKRDRKAGGLAVAVGETLEATGGGWFGWSGEVTPDARELKPTIKLVDGIYIVTIDLTSEELAGYYFGFSNQWLCPLLQYRVDFMQSCGSTSASSRSGSSCMCRFRHLRWSLGFPGIMTCSRN